MLYYLFQYLDQIDVPGARMFTYISFRSAIAFLLSMILSIIFGKYLIQFLQKKKYGEIIRDLGLQGQMEKKGTPTMGGILILGTLLIATLLCARIENVYIMLMLITTVWLGALGFADDYIKVFKKNKEGLPGKIKIVGQIGLGLIVGLTLYFSNYVVTVENVRAKTVDASEIVQHKATSEQAMLPESVREVKSTKTTIPFFKNNEFDYESLVSFAGEYSKYLKWIVFVIMVIFVTTAVSNGANLTDGMDGLLAGTSIPVILALSILAYLGGNVIYAEYLNIMYIPYSGELMVFASALLGALVGFLWYNWYPAQLFMGDTGSLAIGGIIAVFAILIRKEILIPVLCGIFLVENLSVMMQVSYFKYTKKKFGEGRRIFLMSPLHHHFQKKGMPESRIVGRFWIIAIMLAIATLTTLKMR